MVLIRGRDAQGVPGLRDFNFTEEEIAIYRLSFLSAVNVELTVVEMQGSNLERPNG